MHACWVQTVWTDQKLHGHFVLWAISAIGTLPAPYSSNVDSAFMQRRIWRCHWRDSMPTSCSTIVNLWWLLYAIHHPTEAINGLENHLTLVPNLQSNVFLAFQSHDAFPIDNGVLITFKNLGYLQDDIILVKNMTQTTLYEFLDRYPSRTELQLTCIMKEVSLIDTCEADTYSI